MSTPSLHQTASADVTAEFAPGPEFDRQVDVLRDKGYPALLDLTPAAFTDLVAPLRDLAVARTAGSAPPTPGRVPFVLVVTRGAVGAERRMPLTERGGRPGFADFDAADIARFEPLPDLAVPAGPYLVFDVERGKESLDVSPDDAMVTITAQGRTPLTVDEGIAYLTVHPESLEKNNCYMLAGSRCGDRRVPALWISKKAPKLGWCWAGNRHTWLGIASCAGRTAAP